MADSLRRCVDSVLAQRISDCELLLVDDGSTDESGRIADDYAAKHACIRCFHKPNGGLSDARNFGLQHAVGRYVTFVDSDDVLVDTTSDRRFQVSKINDVLELRRIPVVVVIMAAELNIKDAAYSVGAAAVRPDCGRGDR